MLKITRELKLLYKFILRYLKVLFRRRKGAKKKSDPDLYQRIMME